MFIALVCVGFACIASALCWLVMLNWGPVVQVTALSATLGGMTTILVAVLSGLEEPQKIEDVFTINTVFDKQRKLPKFDISSSPTDPGFIAQSWFQSTNFKQDLLPASTSESFSFLGEVLQFKLLADLSTMGLETVTSGSAPSTYVSAAGPLKRPSDSVKLPLRSVTSIFPNRFVSQQIAQNVVAGEIYELPIPVGTSIILSHAEAAGTDGEKFILGLHKDHFFDIEIIVKPLAMSGTFSDPSPTAMVSYTIFMIATFNRISAAGTKATEYREWAKWVFTEIKHKWTGIK